VGNRIQRPAVEKSLPIIQKKETVVLHERENQFPRDGVHVSQKKKSTTTLLKKERGGQKEKVFWKEKEQKPR